MTASRPRANAFDSWAIRESVPALKARYLRSAGQSDTALGRVLAALKATGRFDSTVIVATGDHGEAFAEHGVLMHGSRLDEEQLRVPLILKLPGVAPREVSEVSIHQDVQPTLLSYLGAVVKSGPAPESTCWRPLRPRACLSWGPVASQRPWAMRPSWTK